MLESRTVWQDTRYEIIRDRRSKEVVLRLAIKGDIDRESFGRIQSESWAAKSKQPVTSGILSHNDCDPARITRRS